MGRKHFGCKVAGCGGKHVGRGYCNRHLQQIRQYGRIIHPSYLVTDPNEVNDYGDYLGIVLKNRYGVVTGEALIDKNISEDILQYKWHQTKTGYVGRKETGKNGICLLHWHLVDRPAGFVIDHINGNKLDNRLDNLRVCTQSENMRNARVRIDNVSGVSGVHLNKNKDKWRARIKVDGKQKNLGTFDDLEDAKAARIKAELKYYKEYSPVLSQNSEVPDGIKIPDIAFSGPSGRQMVAAP